MKETIKEQTRVNLKTGEQHKNLCNRNLVLQKKVDQGKTDISHKY